MSQSLGAINQRTGEYVYPKIANKKDDYNCPECKKELILVQGESRVHHFRHKVDSNPCHYYSKPTESQIHKDAKRLMKTLLENKTRMKFVRTCTSCKINTDIHLPELLEDSLITLEHRFTYEDQLRIADVAHTLHGEIKAIYEICNTHKTCSEDRPEPWVEVDANTLIASVNMDEPVVPCIRCEKCEKCVMKEGEKAVHKFFDDIQQNKYQFITEKASLFAPNFPETTKIIPFGDEIIVDCENNFKRIEKKTMDTFNINTIEDLIRHDNIRKHDKQRSLKCFRYVRERYEMSGVEPMNGNNVIQLGKYAIIIRILPNGRIKYCKSCGETDVKNFTLIGIE